MPALAEVRGHRLGQATPYLLPRADELLLFLCRFERGARLRVALPEQATAGERELLQLALAAWTEAGLGLSLAAASEGEPADISIGIGAVGQGFSARTGTECGLAGVDASDGVLPARLVAAEIELRRADLDVRRHVVPLSPEEFLGSALHELGHALGFQGHVRGGSSVMVRNVETVRGIGRRLLAGQPFRDASLEALYRIESGVVVGRTPLPEGRTRAVDRLLAIAAARGFRGPVVRVGDRGARISWWDEDARRLSIHVPDLMEVLRDPASLRLQPGPHAVRALRAK